MAKNDKSVDARLRLPRTKTSSFELQLQLQRGTRRRGEWFPSGQTSYENAKQSKSKLGLLLHCGQLPTAADFNELPESLQKKYLLFKNKNGFVIVAVNLSFRASFLCVIIFSRGLNLTVNKIPANKTFWKTRLDVWLRGGRSCQWFANLLSSWKPRNSIACYNQIAPGY